MNTRFAGKSSGGFKRRNEKERLFFIAAAGLAFSLLIITLVVFNFKTDANAKNDITPKAENKIPTSLGTVTLYAPEKMVPQGTKLSGIKMKEVYWPHDQLPEGAIRDLAEVKDKYATETLRALVPLQRIMLSAEPVQRSLPVTPGNRAIAIEVDAFSSIEGHISPGSKVDVTLTYYENGNLTTKFLVQNARILSYGGNMSTRSAFVEGPKKISNSVTLDVSIDDSLKILTAKKLGSLSLVMRAPDDNEASSTTEMNETAIEGGRKNAPAKGTGGACGRAKVGGIEMIIPCQAGESPTMLKNDYE